MSDISADKQQALDKFFEFMADPKKKEMGIIGEPGCGKTWFINYLLKQLRKKETIKNHLIGGNEFSQIALAAPTNEAAATLSDATSLPASTLHSLFGLRLRNDFKTGKTITEKTRDFKMQHNVLLIVDEAGWLDKTMTDYIRSSCVNSKVLYVGDPKQLVTVGETESYVFDTLDTVAHLSQNFRNDNFIGKFAKKYRDSVGKAKLPRLLPDNDLVQFVDESEMKELIQHHFLGDNFRKKNHAKIIAWRNSTVKEYNDYVRSCFTDYQEFEPGEIVTCAKPVLQNGMVQYHTDSTFIIDKLVDSFTIQGIECYEAITTDGVRIVIPYDYSEVSALLKRLYEEGKSNGNYFDFFATKDAFNDIRPIYAGTVHKSQGKTHDVTFIDLNDMGCCQSLIDFQRLMTVATSRPRHRLYLFGDLPIHYGGTN